MPPSQHPPPASANQPISSTDPADLAAKTTAPDEIIDPVTGKRRAMNIAGTKQASEAQNTTSPSAPNTLLPQTRTAINAMKPPSPETTLHPQPTPVSPIRQPYSPALAATASPSRLRSSSPNPQHSPASSEIFERNVQEPIPLSALQSELDQSHIPAHMMTEDSIPPALEASAQAITSEKLGVDEVEIVTSASHQFAGAGVLDGHGEGVLSQVRSEDASERGSLGHASASNFLPAGGEDDGASTYGQLDPNDVRRLSFISFADVVQSEHHHHPHGSPSLREVGSRDSLQAGSLSSLAHGAALERTGSPLRSPRSPASVSTHSPTKGVVTPPKTGLGEGGAELSPARSPASMSGLDSVSMASLGAGSTSGLHGELTIETMRQAVRKTASGDLSGVRSAGMSPTSDGASLSDVRSRVDS